MDKINRGAARNFVNASYNASISNYGESVHRFPYRIPIKHLERALVTSIVINDNKTGYLISSCLMSRYFDMLSRSMPTPLNMAYMFEINGDRSNALKVLSFCNIEYQDFIKHKISLDSSPFQDRRDNRRQGVSLTMFKKMASNTLFLKKNGKIPISITDIQSIAYDLKEESLTRREFFDSFLVTLSNNIRRNLSNDLGFLSSFHADLSFNVTILVSLLDILVEKGVISIPKISTFINYWVEYILSLDHLPSRYMEATYLVTAFLRGSKFCDGDNKLTQEYHQLKDFHLNNLFLRLQRNNALDFHFRKNQVTVPAECKIPLFRAILRYYASKRGNSLLEIENTIREWNLQMQSSCIDGPFSRVSITPVLEETYRHIYHLALPWKSKVVLAESFLRSFLDLHEQSEGTPISQKACPFIAKLVLFKYAPYFDTVSALLHAKTNNQDICEESWHALQSLLPTILQSIELTILHDVDSLGAQYHRLSTKDLRIAILTEVEQDLRRIWNAWSDETNMENSTIERDEDDLVDMSDLYTAHRNGRISSGSEKSNYNMRDSDHEGSFGDLVNHSDDFSNLLPFNDYKMAGFEDLKSLPNYEECFKEQLIDDRYSEEFAFLRFEFAKNLQYAPLESSRQLMALFLYRIIQLVRRKLSHLGHQQIVPKVISLFGFSSQDADMHVMESWMILFMELTSSNAINSLDWTQIAKYCRNRPESFVLECCLEAVLRQGSLPIPGCIHNLVLGLSVSDPCTATKLMEIFAAKASVPYLRTFYSMTNVLFNHEHIGPTLSESLFYLAMKYYGKKAVYENFGLIRNRSKWLLQRHELDLLVYHCRLFVYQTLLEGYGCTHVQHLISDLIGHLSEPETWEYAEKLVDLLVEELKMKPLFASYNKYLECCYAMNDEDVLQKVNDQKYRVSLSYSECPSIPNQKVMEKLENEMRLKSAKVFDIKLCKWI